MRISDIILFVLSSSAWILLSGLASLRLLRWLAIAQEKEYRWDRFWSLINSRAGWYELSKLFYRQPELRRSSIRRPRVTMRILVTLIAALVLIASLTIFLQQFGVPLFVASVLVWLVIPVIIMLIAVSTTALKHWYTSYLLNKVQRLIQQNKPIVIGVTGSYGKTSTKLFLAHLISGHDSVLTTSGSINTLLGVARYLLAHYKNQKYIVLEYAAYRHNEIARLAAAVAPTHAVITGVTHQHAGLFGSLDAIIKAKSELPDALPNSAESRIYYPAHEPQVAQIAAAAPNQVVHVQLDPTIYASSQLTKEGKLKLQWYEHSINTHFVGQQYALNCALALEVAKDLGIPTQDLLRAAETFQPGKNYQSIREGKNGVVILDDSGTSNPVGFQAMMETAKNIPAAQKVLVCGGIPDLGSDSVSIHADLARKTDKIFNLVIYTNKVHDTLFKQTRTQPTIIGAQAAEDALDNLESDTLLCIEGRIPGWLISTVQDLS